MTAVEIQKQALTAYRNGQHTQSLAICDDGLKRYPDAHFLYFLKGSALMAVRSPDEMAITEQGIENIRIATILAPAETSYHMSLATALATQERWSEALLSVRHCLRLRPDSDKAQMLCARLLARLDQPQEAAKFWDALKASNKLSPGQQREYAAALSALGRHADALATLESLADSTEADDHLKTAMGMTSLALGDFDRGWDLYASRANRGVHETTFPFPKWNGEPLAGKAIVVQGEQGLGDEIMFSSIVPELIEEASRVIVACREPLVELFAASMPKAIVLPQRAGAAVADISGLGDIDFRCLVGDLARFRRRTINAFDGRGRYIDVPRDHVKRVCSIMRALAPSFDATRNIGLVWATGSASSKDALQFARQKTISPDLLGVLAGLPDVRFFSLQNVNHAPQAGEIPGLDVVDLAHHLPDFIDTAAALENLSLLITVDTAQAHLAGAMGVPCWIMLPTSPDWRWGTSGSRSYWYDSVRLFRRGPGTTWENSLREVRQALQNGRLPFAC